MIMALKKFIIERDIPKVGSFEREQLRQAAAKSNDVLRQLGPDIQWVESYVADILCLPCQRRGDHSQACRTQRLSSDQNHRSEEDDRSDHRRGLNFWPRRQAKRLEPRVAGNIPNAARE